jgi:probable phosphoglycerate mutase
MAIIIFVRHGQGYNNVEKILSHDNDKYPLTSEGIEQAKRVAEELKKIRISSIFTSPVLRAYQTAVIIGKELNLTPIIDERLRERNLGNLNNKKIDLNNNWRLKLYKREHDFKDIETWDQLKRRINDFINFIKFDKNIVVAVTHYDPIRAFVASILGLGEIESWGLCISNCSLTIAICEDKCNILSIGSPLITSNVLSILNNYIIR